ncbi:MAG: O-antigen ligase family protein [Desulfobacteraceae bacterium]|nr:O-antigen ligase family protein [Desulfobacteraceae bacterium]MBC2718451.1 O-antigen ligase family protein [Desulfobacteraceae bacterium]
MSRLRYLAPLLLGGSIGLLVGYDPFIKDRFKIEFQYQNLLSLFPYKFSTVFILLVIGTVVGIVYIFKNIKWAFDHKVEIFIVSLVTTNQLTSLTGRIDLSDLVAILFLILFFVYNFTYPEYKLEKNPINLLNLLLFGFAFLSTGINAKGSIIALLVLTMPLIKALMVFFLVVNLVRKRHQAIFFLKTFIVVTTFSAFLGIIQEIIYFFTHIALVGVMDDKAKDFIFEYTSYGNFLRVPALTGWYLSLANLVSISLAIIFNFLLYPEVLGKKQKQRRFLIIALIINSIALFLTFSRTTYLAVFILIIISVMVKKSSLLLHFVVFGIALLALGHLMGLSTVFYEHMETDIHVLGDVGIRTNLARDAIEGSMHKKPLFGVGHWKGIIHTVNVNGWPVHNAFILAINEIGLCGFLIYCSIYIVIFYRLIMTMALVRESQDKVILKGLILGYLAFLINIQFHPSFISNFHWIYFGFLESIHSSLRKTYLERRVPQEARPLNCCYF